MSTRQSTTGSNPRIRKTRINPFFFRRILGKNPNPSQNFGGLAVLVESKAMLFRLSIYSRRKYYFLCCNQTMGRRGEYCISILKISFSLATFNIHLCLKFLRQKTLPNGSIYILFYYVKISIRICFIFINFHS